MKPLRVFLAHRAHAEWQPVARQVEAAIAALMPQRDVTVVGGAVDYEQWGGWAGWIESIPERYHLIVVPDPVIGTATRRILAGAFNAGKPPVWAWGAEADGGADDFLGKVIGTEKLPEDGRQSRLLLL
jgi:hypothetical protein